VQTVFDPRTAQVTFVVIDPEILSWVIGTVPLLLHVENAKVKATSTGKLFDSLHRNNAVAELFCGLLP
jgi:hypothetical protein